MANGQLKRILRRRPEVDEVESELEERVRARLRNLPVDTGEGPDIAPGSTSTIESPPGSGIGVVAQPERPWWSLFEPDPEPEPVAAVEPEVAAVEPEPVVPADAEAGSFEAVPATRSPRRRSASSAKVTTASSPGPSEPARPPAVSAVAPTSRRPAGAASTAAPAPYCPYCAHLLSPPPTTSRRCPRCRERIVVKHVDGRAVYLTTAALAVFDLEHRRTVDSVRWAKQRTRWLKAAVTVGAPAEKVARLGSAPLSADVVAASQALYMTTVDRSFRAAKRERRWQDASRIMRDHAGLLYRFAGSPLPPPEHIVALYQEGPKAVLRGLDAIARVAEVGAVRCCPTCEADDGRVFEIAAELRAPRLPHAGCPKGLCRCDWFLVAGDHMELRRQVRRRTRTATVVRPPS